MTALTVGPSFPAGAAPDENPAERAAREIEEARQQANDAATAFFDAESQIDTLELEAVELQAQRKVLARRVERLRGDVERLAVDRFVSAGTIGIPLLTDAKGPSEQRQADQFASVVLDTSATDLDDYDEARQALDEKDGEISDQTDELEDVKATYVVLKDEALAEVERLETVEVERLEDEAVQRELDRRREEERQRLVEAAALAERQAAAERRAAATTTTTTPAPDMSATTAAANTTAATEAPDTTEPTTTQAPETTLSAATTAPRDPASTSPRTTVQPTTAPPTTAPPTTTAPPPTTAPPGTTARPGTTAPATVATSQPSARPTRTSNGSTTS